MLVSLSVASSLPWAGGGFLPARHRSRTPANREATKIDRQTTIAMITPVETGLWPGTMDDESSVELGGLVVSKGACEAKV